MKLALKKLRTEKLKWPCNIDLTNLGNFSIYLLPNKTEWCKRSKFVFNVNKNFPFE